MTSTVSKTNDQVRRAILAVNDRFYSLRNAVPATHKLQGLIDSVRAALGNLWGKCNSEYNLTDDAFSNLSQQLDELKNSPSADYMVLHQVGLLEAAIRALAEEVDRK